MSSDQYNRDSFRVLSSPVRLHWLGWETDTCQLQRAGWQLSAQENPATATMIVAFQHRATNIGGITEVEVYPRSNPWETDHGRVLRMQVQKVGFALQIANYTSVGHTRPWQPIDAEPSITTDRIRSLDDLCHFAPRFAPNAVIIPEPDVQELLQAILAKQDPERQAYYAEKVIREQVDFPKIEAQILSFPKFASAR